jgi:hypothetical protein
MVIGSRIQVWHGNADKTPGGLGKKDLFQDKYGRIRSRAASRVAKKLNNLGEHKLPKGVGQFIPGGRTKLVRGRKPNSFRAGVFDPSMNRNTRISLIRKAFEQNDAKSLLNYARADKGLVNTVYYDTMIDGDFELTYDPLAIGLPMFIALLRIIEQEGAEDMIEQALKQLSDLDPTDVTYDHIRIVREIVAYPAGKYYTKKYLKVMKSQALREILSEEFKHTTNPIYNPVFVRTVDEAELDIGLQIDLKRLPPTSKKEVIATILSKHDASEHDIYANPNEQDPRGKFHRILTKYTNRLKKARNKECSVCYEDIKGTGVMCRKCRNQFHPDCRNACLKQDECPYCRSKKGFYSPRVKKRKRSANDDRGKEAEDD